MNQYMAKGKRITIDVENQTYEVGKIKKVTNVPKNKTDAKEMLRKMILKVGHQRWCTISASLATLEKQGMMELLEAL